jgi:hypothetical protein
LLFLQITSADNLRSGDVIDRECGAQLRSNAIASLAQIGFSGAADGRPAVRPASAIKNTRALRHKKRANGIRMRSLYQVWPVVGGSRQDSDLKACAG